MSANDEVTKVKAIATGGWNDGPKPLGGALGFGEKPEISAAVTIPAIGFVPPSTGGFEIRTDDVLDTRIASASAASFSDVKFGAGDRYILMSVGTGVTSTILAFALPTAVNAPVADAGAPARPARGSRPSTTPKTLPSSRRAFLHRTTRH